MSLQTQNGPAEGVETGCSTNSPVESFACASRVGDMLSCFNHRCRNTLNGIKMSLYLFKRGVGGPTPCTLGELERSYQQIEVLFDRLQMIYRPFSLTLVRAPLGRFFDERSTSWQSRFNVRGRKLEINPPVHDLPGDFDPMLLGLALDALIEWRAEASKPGTRADFSWSIADSSLELTWAERQAENDLVGCGCDQGLARKHDLNGGVDSLAHLLLKRIILAHGGTLEISDDPSFVMTLCWPRLQAAEPVKCSVVNG